MRNMQALKELQDKLLKLNLHGEVISKPGGSFEIKPSELSRNWRSNFNRDWIKLEDANIQINKYASMCYDADHQSYVIVIELTDNWN